MTQKLILTILMLCVFSVKTQAQNMYKPFKVDLGFLVGFPADELFNYGGGIYIEPKYNVHDNIAVGLRLEAAALATVDLENAEGEVAAVSSYLLTGDYYLGTNTLRPFVGVGGGMYSIRNASADANTTDFDLSAKNNFGFAPRLGLLLGHFRMALAYNVIMDAEENMPSFNYMSIKVGFEIGGGKTGHGASHKKRKHPKRRKRYKRR